MLQEDVETLRLIVSHLEFDTHLTVCHLKSSQVIPIEGGKFNILKHDRNYGLQRASDGEVIGWMALDPKKTLGNRVVHPIDSIDILPKFRHSGAAIKFFLGNYTNRYN